MTGTPHPATVASPATVRHYIDGRHVAGATGRTFENRSPVDGSHVSPVAEAGADEMDAAVAAATAGSRLRNPRH